LNTKRSIVTITCILLAYLMLTTVAITQAQTEVTVNLQSTGSIAAPSPSPSPTLSPTPTPTPNPYNLVPTPQGWSTAYTGMHYGIGGVANVVLDLNVGFNNNPSVRIDPVGNTDNYAREADGPIMTIHPGDHIVFICWIRTSASSIGDTSVIHGGRIGIDFYGTQRITGSAAPDGAVWTPTEGYPSSELYNYVRWGTSTWTKITMDFIVASQYPADQWAGYPVGQMVVPTRIIPWIQVMCSSADQGQGWFGGSELYINP
jgi:hypothetical protein